MSQFLRGEKKERSFPLKKLYSTEDTLFPKSERILGQLRGVNSSVTMLHLHVSIWKPLADSNFSISNQQRENAEVVPGNKRGREGGKKREQKKEDMAWCLLNLFL